MFLLNNIGITILNDCPPTVYPSIDRHIVEYFLKDFPLGNEWGNLFLVTISLLLSIILGGSLGFQREINGHAAGLRTHILISLSSCLLMIISQYGTNGYLGNRDPMRLAAAAVTGIGFLGAGTIVQNGISVKGLTTAATIWIAMAIGIACGSGWMIVAIITTVFALIVLASLIKIEQFASKRSTNIVVIASKESNAVVTILEVAEKKDLSLKDIDTTIVKFNNEDVVRITFRLASRDSKKIKSFVKDLKIYLEPIKINTLS
ncbi:MAG: MgtC/SapB family protein [Bacillales bacterium]